MSYRCRQSGRVIIGWDSAGAKLLAYLAMTLAVVAADVPSEPVLTSVAQVKALSRTAAAEAKAVRLHGVVTVFLGIRSGFFLQDATGGIFVMPRRGSPAEAEPGDWVECVGTTSAGQYAPTVLPVTVERLGRGQIPAPVAVSLHEFAAGRQDGEWVETIGVVRTIAIKPNTRPEFQISVGHERLRVQVCELEGRPPESLVDAEVRVSGVASGFFNRDRQLLMPVLFAPDWHNVVVTTVGATDPFAMELRSATSLFRYAPHESAGHRAKVRGTLTHQLPGKAIFLRDGDGPLYVETTQTGLVAPGDIVEAVGFPAVRQGAPYLQDAIYRVTGATQPPQPVRAEPSAIAQGHVRPSELVSIVGQLVETRDLRDRWLLSLKAGEQTFEVQVETGGGQHAASLPAVGGQLRASGVLWPEDTEPRSRNLVPTAFRLLSRSPADIAILAQPSWWTRGRLAQVAIGLLCVTAAAFVWIWMLRRRVEAQTSTIAEKVAREAVAEERARTACEIHDTLAQGFMGLGFQLEALSGEMQTATPGARQQLERAMKMLRHSHDEVRYSLRQLREPAAEPRSLATALQETVRRSLVNFRSENFRFTARGTPFSLPPVTEHNILRIGQEAATNAVKHARARMIAVELEHGPSELHLRIEDDGCGIELAAPDGEAREHFGLQIMRERAQRIGGALEIDSHPGAGTRIQLTVPRPQPALRSEKARA